MTLIRAVEFTLIRTIGLIGEKVLMSIAARDFIRNRDLSLAAYRAFEPDPAPVVPFWGCREHHRAGPCAVCQFESEFPADTSSPLPPNCAAAADTFRQHTRSK